MWTGLQMGAHPRSGADIEMGEFTEIDISISSGEYNEMGEITAGVGVSSTTRLTADPFSDNNASGYDEQTSHETTNRSPRLHLSPPVSDLESGLYQAVQDVSQPEGKDGVSEGEDDATYTFERPPSHPDYTDCRMPNCPPRKELHTRKLSSYSLAVILLTLYSVIGGIVILYFAASNKVWSSVGPTGLTSQTTAVTLVTLGAITVGGAFAFGYSNFIGQMLSRRAMGPDSTGMSVYEMLIRQWLCQPTMLIFHPKMFWHAITTPLGGMAFIAAVIILFYTVATVTLVSPVLVIGPLQTRMLYGMVATEYADPSYIAKTCQSPISIKEDPNTSQNCLEIEHLGQASHNFLGYTTAWASIAEDGTDKSIWMKDRTLPTANLYNNITVEGVWVDTSYSNMTESYLAYGLIVNNVSMSFPHASIAKAAQDGINGIIPPSGLTGANVEVHAAVPAPSVNVQCVNVHGRDIENLIQGDQSGSSNTYWGDWLKSMPWARLVAWNDTDILGPPTDVDDIFRWGDKYGRQRPNFPIFPADYNTVLGLTTNTSSDTIHLLAKSPATSNFTLCSLRSYLNYGCETYYNISSGGGSLVSLCDSSNSGEPNPVSFSSGWVSEASDLAFAMSWNDGMTDLNDSNARMLTQFIPTVTSLNPLQPSIAEALAVQVGCSLLLGALDSPLVPEWKYDDSSLMNHGYQGFNATVKTLAYVSTTEQAWHHVFLIVLVLLPLGGLMILAYFVWVFFFSSSRGLVQDYTDLAKMFALAVNSPGSDLFRGACGGGVVDEQLQYPWFIKTTDAGHPYWHAQETRGVRVKELEPRSLTIKRGSTMFSLATMTSTRMHPLIPLGGNALIMESDDC